MATPVRHLSSASRPPVCARCGTPTRSRARQVESIAHCTHCGEDVCWIDGIPLDEHLRCSACQVLVGSHHATLYLRDGLCPSCARWRDRGLPLPEAEQDEDHLLARR